MLNVAMISKAVFSLILVVCLILVSAWLLRAWQVYRTKIAAGTGKAGLFKNLMPRAGGSQLEIVESRAIDFKRKLVLVRRGEVLHLLLCGEERDIVIETAIPHDSRAESNQTE